MTDALAKFADEVGPEGAGPVVAVGGRTAYDVGGPVDPAAREVRAPAGIVELFPEEMTVRVRAGTTVDELDAALAEVGQCVALPGGHGATIGGVLAVGRSGVRRLGWGPIRDTLLEAHYVSAEGRVVKAGGPTVKNVSGFDLCRVLVGSLGTLGLVGEVVLRTRPLPATEQWFVSDADPARLLRNLHRPTAILWNGERAWVLLDGHPNDVLEEAARAGLSHTAPNALPALPPHRWSIRPSVIPSLPDDGLGPFVAQVGVGVVFRDVPQPLRPVDPAVAEIHHRMKKEFDPTGRLAPGRDVLRASA